MVLCLMCVVLGDLETCLEIENAGYMTEESRDVCASSKCKSSNLNEQLK